MTDGQTDIQPQYYGLVDGPAHRAEILINCPSQFKVLDTKSFSFPDMESPLEYSPKCPPFSYLEGQGIVQGCGESRPCPSSVSTFRYPHRRDPSGSAHQHTDLLGFGQFPPSPSLVTGPPTFGAIGRWQSDETKTRIRKATVHVGFCSREGHVTRELRTPIATPTGNGLELSHPFPLLPHQVLPLIFLCQSQKSGLASSCVWNLPFFN